MLLAEIIGGYNFDNKCSVTRLADAHGNLS